jgi:hypothetical protein
MVLIQRRPAEHCFLVVFVLVLCGGALAASPARYLSVSIDTVINSKTQLNCYDPDTTIAGMHAIILLYRKMRLC